MSATGLTVNVLGCGSAMPTAWHNPSCQVIDYRGVLYMIDCGEGAQAQMRKMRLPMSRLRHIFISHLHGDHVLGLPGLLSTMALQDLSGTVTVHIHPQGIELLRPLIDTFCADRPYALEWEPLPEKPDAGTILVDSKSLAISCFPLSHRIAACGFRFDEKPKPRHLRADMLEFYGVGIAARERLREGEPFIAPDGRVIPNEWLTSAPTPSLSYAYASDTIASPAVAAASRGVTLLYHEATYADDHASQARPRGHSTAREAGMIAREAGARALMIGHYSKRYHSVEALREQAAEAFGGPVIAAQEGMRVDVDQFAPKP